MPRSVAGEAQGADDLSGAQRRGCGPSTVRTRAAETTEDSRNSTTWNGSVHCTAADPASINPTTVTVSRDPCGRWYVSFAVEVAGPDQIPATGAVVGVDLGIKDFAVTSSGVKIPNPRKLARRERNLARYQRRLARCQKGSANRAKAKAKVARAHRKVRASHRLPAPHLYPPGPRP